MKSIPTELVPSLNAFLTMVNDGIKEYWHDMKFCHSTPPKVGIHNIGKRYARIVDFEQRNGEWKASSVYCFLDLTNGNLHKGSWKSPVPNGVRANLNMAPGELAKKFTPHGPAYLGGSHTGTLADYLGIES